MLSKNSGNGKNRNGLEAKLEKFIERIDSYIHHNEKEKDRIWHSVSRHDKQIMALQKQSAQTLGEIQHLRQEFRRWIREQ